jgi:hypothetical protein
MTYLAAWYAPISGVPADGSKLDEMVRVLAQYWKHSPGDIDDSEQIGLDLNAKIFLVHLFNRRIAYITGVVHHNVEFTELLERQLGDFTSGCTRYVSATARIRSPYCCIKFIKLFRKIGARYPLYLCCRARP